MNTDHDPFHGLLRGHYGLIMADPAWNTKAYSDKGLKGRPQHYERMSLADIKELPVAGLAAKDCHLFLWTTSPHLQHGFEVLKAWGFRYSAIAFTWVKLNPRAPELFTVPQDYHMGQGYTTRQNTEVCLLGKRGSPKRLRKDIRELIVAPRRRHSEKPEEAYERCVQFAEGPYLDMFSRRAREGWDAWGHESGKYDRLEAAQ